MMLGWGAASGDMRKCGESWGRYEEVGKRENELFGGREQRGSGRGGGGSCSEHLLMRDGLAMLGPL